MGQGVNSATLTIPNPVVGGVLHVVHGPPLASTLRSFRPKLAQITDGTSNTVAVTEYHTKTSNRNRAFWGYGRNQYSHAAATPLAATRLPNFDECVRLTNNDPGIACRPAASLHTNGNAVFADGSVRFLAFDTECSRIHGPGRHRDGERSPILDQCDGSGDARCERWRLLSPCLPCGCSAARVPRSRMTLRPCPA
jgi:prepilin-type processing-associated H-X9-DG protein